MKNYIFRKLISLNHEFMDLISRWRWDRKLSEMIVRIKQLQVPQHRLFDQLFKFRLLIFYIIAISYLELIYRLWCFNSINFDYIFPVLFALPAAVVLFSVSSLFGEHINRIVSVFITFIMTFLYAVQLVYYSIFRTPLLTYSLIGTGDALQFADVAATAIIKNAIPLILLLGPIALLILAGKKLLHTKIKPLVLRSMLLFCIAGYSLSMVCVHLTGVGEFSQYSIYYKGISPELSASKLGLMTTVRLDVQRLISDFHYSTSVAAAFQEEETNGINTETDENQGHSAVTPSSSPSGKKYNPGNEHNPKEHNPGNKHDPVNGYRLADGSDHDGESDIGREENIDNSFNIMDIDFESLIANEKNKNILDMHKYFSSVEPTRKNKYTGIFKGHNLIMITAEAFSTYAINPELTPTLYKMTREGFVFNNFYNPVWWVSTSDGEYVACTGLLPKSGVWSFYQSGKNFMPFVMGNQFKKLGYITKAYHNHTYTYYKRNVSHPNMGYDYKGMGNGLEAFVKETWPESDLEMIEATAGEYIGSQPFHAYYMTVSGHMNYNFTGNYIAKKNRELVNHLPYSDAAKAYLACNMELEFALKTLIEKLEAAGVADKTVIAISADHYPYGLPKECIDELAGHNVESNFELHKSTFILWKKGMSPILVSKPCSSLDIIPTLSNLFGLEYDSRLLMGRDILSDSPGLVIFSNRSWITDRASYNSVTNTVKFTDGTEKDPEYVKAINSIVANKFKYSTMILDTDYYRRVIPQDTSAE